ncbi:MAG: peptidylprolyl isomerase [Pseudorhodoplanes sp.]
MLQAPLARLRLSPLMAAGFLSLVLCGPAGAQVVLFVTGEPITAYDIEQRTKLSQLGGGGKAKSRQDVINELIDDKLKILAGKRFSLEVSDSDVETSFAGIARNVGMTSDQFSEQLRKSGVNPSALKARVKADITWGQIVRGRFQQAIQVGEKDVFEAEASRSEPKETGIEYTLHPITFVLPRNSAPALFEARKKEADMLRARFQDCDSGLKFAKALREVVVRAPIRRNSADLSAQLREVLAKVEVGKVTPPEQTAGGIEVFALCEKKETNSDSPTKRKLRDEMFSQRFQKQADRYLKELRGQAMIEYKQAQ